MTGNQNGYSIPGRPQGGREAGLEDRGPLLADVERVYGPGMAAVVARYIDAPDAHPCETRHGGTDPAFVGTKGGPRFDPSIVHPFYTRWSRL